MARLYTITQRKSTEPRSPIVQTLDEWERYSIDAQNKTLGEGWFDDVEAFYNLSNYNDRNLTFRPNIQVPDLQRLMLQEANDLSELSPRVYIINSESDKREEHREDAFDAQWHQSQTTYHMMYANIWALFGGTGWLQIGLDPEGRHGRGSIWVKMRRPGSVRVDPTCDYTMNWCYLMFEDWMHIEQVKKDWPLTASKVRPRVAGRSASPAMSESGFGFQMPEGPMSLVPGLPRSRTMATDNRVRVRWCYCYDYTREEARDIPKGMIIEPDFAWKYPNGRLIVECEGHILQDGDNPYPLKMFPAIPFWGMPLLSEGIWGVPPIRYTKMIQTIIERLYTQNFENIYRTNNGVWFIDEDTGITADDFGGLPGEVRIINKGSRVPAMVHPQAMPQQYQKFPEELLNLQREIQGFTKARRGEAGAGNISSDLFDSSVLRSQGLTQLRGRLFAASTQRLSELMFFTMAKYLDKQKIAKSTDEKFELVDWQGKVMRPDTYDLLLDKASLRPMSEAMLRKIAPELKKQNVISSRRLLKMLDIPDAETAADEVEHEMELAALGKVKGNRR